VAARLLKLSLTGPGGEPVDLWRTLASHGVAELPPAEVDESNRSVRTTLPLPGGKPRTIVISRDGVRDARIEVLGPALGNDRADQLLASVRGMLNLDEDLSGFYSLAATDLDRRSAPPTVRGRPPSAW
jgi:hypothetical protein